MNLKQLGLFLIGSALVVAFWIGVFLIIANPANSYVKHRTYATCYNLHGVMRDGSYTRARSVASNVHRMGTRIRLIGRSFHGRRRFVVRDTGPALSDGHIDIWYMGFSCFAWGRRGITYKLGWGRP